MSLLNFEYPSLEAIDYQTKSLLFKELTAAITEFMDGRVWTIGALAKVGIEEIVKRHTGIRITAYLGRDVGENAYVVLPTLSLNHPLYKSFSEMLRDAVAMGELDRGELNEVYQEVLHKSGLLSKSLDLGIDLRNSKLTGAASTIEYEMRYGVQLFAGNRYTPSEIAAIVLHEIGHVFTYFEWLLKTATTNVILDDAWKRFSGTQDPTIKVKIIDRTTARLNAYVDNEALLKNTSKDYFYSVYLISTFQHIPTALGSSSADHRLSEQVADQFAARHGAARDLATALSKLTRSSIFAFSTYASTRAYVVVTAVRYAILLGLSIAVPPVGLGIVIGLLASLLVPGLDHDVYDPPKLRLEKLLLEIQAALKDQNISKEDRAKLLQDHELIKEAHSKLHDREGLFMLVWRNLTAHRRDQHTQLKFQQELERLVHNELYVKASNFKSLL